MQVVPGVSHWDPIETPAHHKEGIEKSQVQFKVLITSIEI